MALTQPEHDPFAPHEDDGQADVPATQSVTMRRHDGEAVTTLEVTTDETPPSEAVTEDDDRTPPPGPGKRNRANRGRGRTPARSSKLAAELEGE